jgi:hypothetical protein
MNYYDINMECIKTNRENIYKVLKDTYFSTSINDPENITTVPTRDGGQAVVIKYHSIEYRLNSIYNPTTEANKWAEQYKFHNLNNIIPMYGFGNGIFARAIINRMREKDLLLIYEPSAAIFLYVLKNYDMTDILSNKQVILSVEEINDFDFHTILKGITDITNMRDQIICIHPQYDKIFPESCITFWKEIRDSYLNTQVNINTIMKMSNNFIDNTIKNIKYIKSSNTIYDLKEILPNDIPAIVVAAGPSVEKQIEYLKRAKGKAVIFAVDRILDFLLDSGVEPDFVVTLDPIKPVEYFSKRPKITIPLLYYIEANNEILEFHSGRKIICNCSELFEEFYKSHEKLPPRIISSASVATATFSVCVELGFQTIVLVGQDLAFDGENTHAGGIAEKIPVEEDVVVEGVNGELVKSRYDWKLFINWYQDFLNYYPFLTVIDAKEQGARIKGTTVMPLKDVIETYCKQSFIYHLEQLKPVFSVKEQQDYKAYLGANIDILQEIKAKSKEAISILEFLIKESKKNFRSNQIDDKLKKLGKINSYITEQPIHSLMNLYVSAVAAYNISEMYRFTDNIEQDSVKTYERSIQVFKAMKEAADYIVPKLELVVKEEE